MVRIKQQVRAARHRPHDEAMELSIVMPCLNEQRTLGICIAKAIDFLNRHDIRGEVIVADNGSTDGSPELAASLGATVVHVAEPGYGAALAGGIAAARGRYIIMGDSDDSYDFSDLMDFVERLRAGDELVMGNRFRGGIRKGAMPPLHRYFGNPLLTGIGRLFFKSSCGDFYCGLRGFQRQAVQRMQLQSNGMEFALEMLVKATMMGMRISEVPVTLSPDGRDRPPHLRSWRDGWRSLRLFLLYSPRWLFFYPGLVLMLLGGALGLWLLPGPRRVLGVTLDVHTLIYCAAAILLGFQLISFAIFGKMLAMVSGLHPMRPRLDRLLRRPPLEAGLAIGAAMAAGGVAGSAWAIYRWAGEQFGDLDPFRIMRIVIPSVLLLTLGLQIIFSSFYLSLLRQPKVPQQSMRPPGGQRE